MEPSGSHSASTSRQSPRHKRKGRTRDSTAGEPKKMAKLVVNDYQTPASIASSKSSLQKCIDDIESAQVAASSKDLCSLQVYAKRLLETIDRAILAACQREKEQAVGQAASLVTRELEKVRREQEDGQRAADAEIKKLRDEKATLDVIAAAERIKWVVCHQDVAPSADEISNFFRYLSSS